jgi:hypothetical protein
MFVHARAALLAVAFLVTVGASARADQQYTVDGSDTFQIAGRDMRSEIAYRGSQRLHVKQSGKVTTFNATVDYRRIEGGVATHATGSFTSTLLPDGEQRDGPSHDPDYLTILNQPFSIQLDRATLHDLRGLQGDVPFDFPSPMTGAPLHGSLRRLPDGIIHGTRALGVAFRAGGPLHGSLPDRPSMGLSGEIKMNGTAYYAYESAMLLALDATLAIDGNVDASSDHQAVSITYRRTIRPAASPATARR